MSAPGAGLTLAAAVRAKSARQQTMTAAAARCDWLVGDSWGDAAPAPTWRTQGMLALVGIYCCSGNCIGAPRTACLLPETRASPWRISWFGGSSSQRATQVGEQLAWGEARTSSG
jgi:hypothetical protein